jgi:hypothetical protein
MLSLRSKIAVAIASAIMPALVVDYIDGWSSWAEPRAEDWYIGWIIFGILGTVAIVSVVIDVKRYRSSS